MAYDYSLYHYTPSLIAGSIAAVLFFLTTAAHSFQLLKTRTWFFLPFVIGGLFEWIGYIGRIIASKEEYGHWSLGPYILQSLLLLLAPTFLAASIYMILGRLIRLIDGEKFSLVPTRLLTKTFVLGDAFSFLTQSSGGSLLATAKTEQKVNAAQWIIIAGLLLQVIFFSLFIVVTAVFHLRMARHSKKIAQSSNIPWQRYLGVLYAVSALILTRCVFRAVEYIQGSAGYLVTHEVFLYFFDSLIMFTAMMLLSVWHPSTIIGSNRKVARPRDPTLAENEICMRSN